MNQKPDYTLLKPIPRKVGRERTGADRQKIPFSGKDIWNCYEFSFLKKSGKPFVGVLRIEYPAETEYLVESKSLKFYLNSFNMCYFADLQDALDTIRTHLQQILHSSELELTAFTPDVYPRSFTSADGFTCIDDIPSEGSFSYEENPEILDISAPTSTEVFLMSHLLRSNCPFTSQPDWGSVYIYYQPDKKAVTDESLLRYIVSFRNHRGFHEECCERILITLISTLEPLKLVSLCKYTRRGGIDINPLRAYPEETIRNLPPQIMNILYTRDFRQ
jgi:7-cyano-7-deazaguanine reductase